MTKQCVVVVWSWSLSGPVTPVMVTGLLVPWWDEPLPIHNTGWILTK